MCCSVLQSRGLGLHAQSEYLVAVYCSALQCIAVCYNRVDWASIPKIRIASRGGESASESDIKSES